VTTANLIHNATKQW